MPPFFVSVAYVRDPKAWLNFTTTRGKIYNVIWSYTKILVLKYIYIYTPGRRVLVYF